MKASEGATTSSVEVVPGPTGQPSGPRAPPEALKWCRGRLRTVQNGLRGRWPIETAHSLMPQLAGHHFEYASIEVLRWRQHFGGSLPSNPCHEPRRQARATSWDVANLADNC